MAPIARFSLCIAAFGLAALASPAAATSLTVQIDQSTRLNVAGSAASVLVGNPAVADVSVVDSHTLYVLGRGYGVTNLVVLDRDGATLFTGDLVVGSADAGTVSIYRGAARTDLACAPGCQPSLRSPAGGGASGGAGAGGGATLSQALGAVTGGGTP